MTLSGAEHPAKLPGKAHIRPTGGAESGAVAAPALDPELCRVVAAWPTLPSHIRAAFLALIATPRANDERDG